YRYVGVNSYSERSEVDTEEDEERETEAVDVDSLVSTLEEEIDDEVVLDGHLSHHFPADLTVVLRCGPDELEERLEEKGWNEGKIQENVEAEVLDLILQEAARERERVAEIDTRVMEREEVVEIDTTGKEPEEVAETVSGLVDTGGIPEDFLPGHVYWDPEEYLDLP
ncbi:MAG: AAA family ATPase, partial [Candidatus Nanohaloarchaea archaeon]|nr:AAA family ATPase [Candidatus Nanohaloarchaea archaeon]